MKDIENQLNTSNYSRLRFGISQESKIFNQVEFVLGRWEKEEMEMLTERLQRTKDIIDSYCLQGAQNTMNQFNGT